MTSDFSLFDQLPMSTTTLGSLYGSSFALTITQLARRNNKLSLVITDSILEAAFLDEEIQYFAGDLPVYHLADWETLPYDLFSPHPDIISQRLRTLYQLGQIKQGIVIVAAQTLIQRLPPVEFIHQNTLVLNKNDIVDSEKLRQQLSNAGYINVTQVFEHGEFAIRGSIIDIFPMGNNQPIRVDLFDDEIESLHYFDTSSQRSGESIDAIECLPAREFPFDKDAISQFRQRYRNTFEGNPQSNLVYTDISEGVAAAGCEYYFPLFFADTVTLFDYLPEKINVILQQDWQSSIDLHSEDIHNRYEQRRHDIERPILAPETLFLNSADVSTAIQKQIHITLQNYQVDTDLNTAGINIHAQKVTDLTLSPQSQNPSERLQLFLKAYKGRVLFSAESPGRRENFIDFLKNIHINTTTIDNWQNFTEQQQQYSIGVTPLREGMITDHFAIICESSIFGSRTSQSKRRKRRQQSAEMTINMLTDLVEGAPVVHDENGVGRFLGLTTLDMKGMKTEFLLLEYADEDKLYVPVSSLHLISRYTGASADTAPLHRLGSGQWEKVKSKAAKQVRDVAAELLDIFAQREARRGHAFTLSDTEYQIFKQAFPFEETADQQKAIEAVIEDMTTGRPMDRVVCGDVGFGKTEVAMRAAFTALQDNKQVAILAPTTLLAEQHVKNFADRFADWPVKVESLTRFKTKKKQDEVIEQLKAGKIDIIIGTHKLIQSGISYADLGLVIIDEEHRFGVRHKEQLKKLRADVDILTLTATPIPRTLNMAMSGLRDLSIIATPPDSRIAVQTFVNQWNDGLIKEACHRELNRGGQIYFLHNKVETIEKMASTLSELLPEARIAIAHGQLPERELEQIMLDFYHQKYNLLLCTTIIESGIDVPTANTIVINRADHFGLAQLHQLRGRVGRSHHRAYAYLITPPEKLMSADAKKRIDAIESMDTLGSGFILASHDLEIRGAGELLGDEQSGQIQSIGYAMYTDMLSRAVESLKKGEKLNLEQSAQNNTEIDLKIPALLPADYVYDVHMRLVLYKRIAHAKNSDKLRELQVELIDRFGLLPDAAKALFVLTELKLAIQNIGIKKIDATEHGGRIQFNTDAKIDPGKLIMLIQRESETYTFDGKTKLTYIFFSDDSEKRIEFIKDTLGKLAPG